METQDMIYFNLMYVVFFVGMFFCAQIDYWYNLLLFLVWVK